MMLLKTLIQAASDWIRDLLAELLGRCIGVFVAERSKHKRAKLPKRRRGRKVTGATGRRGQ